ncbi:MAG: peptidoglycan editing factor PgeF [Candidatus Neomarinimicrobiota bacterium]|nr:peptidoglycan editing factor PgeF [Candidatus Neomarinimicrobiota bacterium]
MLIDYSEKIDIKDLNILFSLSSFDDSKNTKSIIRMNQTHSNKSLFIDKFSKEYENCDGIFTSNRDLILEIRTADCLPIFFINKNFFGVVHAGWKGLAEGIIENSIELLIRNDFILDDTRVLIGPSISKENFEIRDDVAVFFDNKFLISKNGKTFLSLQDIAINKLNSFNIYDIVDVKECTYSTPHYYSYRRDKTEKRIEGRIYYE